MGFRTTARNLNLNRDYLKVEAPEMAALLDLFGRWQPALYVGLHATDGAKFEHDIAVVVTPLGERPDGLDQSARRLSAALQARLAAVGHLPLDFYPSFIEYDDPASGFRVDEPAPRLSHGYAPARNRIGVLVETHSWRSPGASRIALHLFEPTAPDSFAAWGYFNGLFEQKEYMEAYVAEETARAMLAADPTLRAAFDAWLAADPERAKSAEARLEFFYRRHPSWDGHKNRLPIVKTDSVPAGLGAR